ncbi:MAG: hypothetical protein H7A36_01805 [Chlamydiales bacterium]|nr:hypothetical protein [Chlamydiales bacterium]
MLPIKKLILYTWDMEKSHLKVGAWCAYIMGICYVLIVICAFLSPRSIASYVTSAQYFRDFEGYEWIFVFLKTLMVIANASMVGVIVAFYSISNKKGVLTLFALLAIIGAGIGMFQSVIDATTVPHLAKEYEMADPAIKHVIIAFGVANPGIYALSLGTPGLWFLINYAFFARRLPKFLVLLGLLWGAGNVVTVIAHMLVLVWLIYLVALGAGIAAPLWAIWQAHYFNKYSLTLS